jgi:hypothetical protein
MDTVDKIILTKAVLRVCERLFNKKRKVSSEELETLVNKELPVEMKGNLFTSLLSHFELVTEDFIEEPKP